MTTTADLVAKITPEHAGKPKFAATVALSVDPLVRMTAGLAHLYLDFDLDLALGPQLDAVGVRVNRSRTVPVPLQGLFFSFDDPVRGWDQGVWKGPFEAGVTLYDLDDDTFRRLIRAKILADNWDGTIASLEAIYAFYFDDPATLVFVSDNAYALQPGQSSVAAGDMQITVAFAGKIPTILDLSVLSLGLVGAKPEGVGVDVEVVSVDETPLFGFDLESPFVSGWDAGAWGVPAAGAIALSPQIAPAGTLDFRFVDQSGLLPLL